MLLKLKVTLQLLNAPLAKVTFFRVFVCDASRTGEAARKVLVGERRILYPVHFRTD